MQHLARDYRMAPSGEGPLAAEWQDKPHRLIYDLCSEVDRLEAELIETRRQHAQESPAERQFYLLYPDTYWATERQVRGWLSDCIANGEVDEPPFNVESTPIDVVIEVLQGTGKFTFQEYRDNA